tara:strand:- start:482 stop:685 length:204 start_codon:yes stop_codon:yes gene_type:complete
MSKHKILFYGTDNGSEDHKLETFINVYNEIFISIDMPDFTTSFISLDKSTAIKFAKTLRTEINKIQD